MIATEEPTTRPTAGTWLLLACAIVSEVTGSLALKGALDTTALYALVAIGYLASFVFLSLVLRAGMGLGVAYGIWGALGVALTAVMAAVIYDETLNGVMGLGIVLVIAGVFLVELGSNRAHAAALDLPADAGSTR